MNALLRRWKKNKRKNIKFILALEGLRVGVLGTPAGIINRVWPNLMIILMRILELNGARLAASDDKRKQVILDNVVRSIEQGDFLADPGEGDDGDD